MHQNLEGETGKVATPWLIGEKQRKTSTSKNLGVRMGRVWSSMHATAKALCLD